MNIDLIHAPHSELAEAAKGALSLAMRERSRFDRVDAAGMFFYLAGWLYKSDPRAADLLSAIGEVCRGAR